MDEKFLEFASSAGAPTTMVGSLLLLFFYLRKAEAGMRTEINGSLVRLQQEKEALKAEIAAKETEAEGLQGIIDSLRQARRDAEDAADAQRRRADYEKIRADRAEDLLRKHGLLT